MIDWILPEEAWQIFQTTKQEKRRLEAALKGYFQTACTGAQKQQYAAYIKRRIRPAADMLAQLGMEDLFADLQREGVLSQQMCRELLHRFSTGAYPRAWLALLQLTYGAKEQRPQDEPAAQIPGSRQSVAPADASGDVFQKISRTLGTLFPALAPAFLFFRAVPAPDRTDRMGTDGAACLYHPSFVTEMAGRDLPMLRRWYLHCLLHCLVGQWKLQKQQADRLVEQLIEEECSRRGVVRALLGEYPAADLQQPDGLDDHHLWPGNDSDAAAQQRGWALLLGSGGAFGTKGPGGRAGEGIGSLSGMMEDALGLISRSPHDYRRFLRRFAQPKEEAVMDLESFDYIYYTYGMEHLGNVPLLENLEYREGHKLEELVIAIDTSGSCSAQLVRAFLEESRAILEQKENFFEDMRVYLLQCDCSVQDVALIRSLQDWKRYCRDLQIKGRSGTDFRPVFRYVERLRGEGKLKHLKCLIYFTDGDGVYPTKPPDYETAFVFVRRKACAEKVPDWAWQLEVEDLT